MSSVWGKVEPLPSESINLAEIMSEEYAHRVHDLEVKRFEKKTLQSKQKVAQSPLFEGASGSGVTYSQAAAAQPTTQQSGGGDWEDYSQLLEANTTDLPQPDTSEEWEDYSALLEQEAETAAAQGKTLPPEVLELFRNEDESSSSGVVGCDSDAVIAQMLQSQFDHEHNLELHRIEQKNNKQSKITVTLDKFRRNGDLEFLDQPDVVNDCDDGNRHDWDRFETNEKLFDTIPKRGFRVDKEGEMITKHDAELCGVRNACRVMSFPPDFPTGDGAGFDMKLSNQVFNQLKSYSQRSGGGKKNRQSDRKVNMATVETGMDAPTRLLLYKLINNQILESINGIISTGKEAVILHANSDPAYAGGGDSQGQGPHGNVAFMPPNLLPKECAIKVFRTTLNEFKQRDRYIKDDYRFKERFSKQNKRVVIAMWAQKELQNLMRMQSVGLNCPDVVTLKKHVLVMAFIGKDGKAAPKLKDVQLSVAELSLAYEEIITAMLKLYHEAKLVHSDLSEYNILWHEGKCWFIDVAQAVEPGHPGALEFLMRDCGNIVNFFSKRGLSNILTQEQLFERITGHDAEKNSVALLERIHTRGPNIKQATAPNQDDCPDVLKPLVYPFDLAWEKSQEDRKIDAAMQALNVQEAQKTAQSETESSKSLATVTAANNNTAKH